MACSGQSLLQQESLPFALATSPITHLAQQPDKIHEKLPDAAGAFDCKARCPFQLNIKKG